MSKSEGEFGFEIEAEVVDDLAATETEDMAEAAAVEHTGIVTLATSPRDLFGTLVRHNDIITYCTANIIRVGRVTNLASTYFQAEPIAQVGTTTRWRKCGQKRTITAGSRFVIITPIAKNIAVIV